MAGGMAADLMQINWNWINIFSKDGNGLYDLNSLSSDIDLSQYEQILLDQCIVDGKLNAIPYGVAGRVFLYNKTTYDKAGLKVPSSFEEIKEAGKVMKEKL